MMSLSIYSLVRDRSSPRHSSSLVVDQKTKKSLMDHLFCGIAVVQYK
jgi:hypothetical protein